MHEMVMRFFFASNLLEYSNRGDGTIPIGNISCKSTAVG